MRIAGAKSTDVRDWVAESFVPQNNVETSVVEPVKLLSKAMSKAAWQCVDCTGCSVLHLLANTVAIGLFDVLFEFVVAVRVFVLFVFEELPSLFFLK